MEVPIKVTVKKYSVANRLMYFKRLTNFTGDGFQNHGLMHTNVWINEGYARPVKVHVNMHKYKNVIKMPAI